MGALSPPPLRRRLFVESVFLVDNVLTRGYANGSRLATTMEGKNMKRTRSMAAGLMLAGTLIFSAAGSASAWSSQSNMACGSGDNLQSNIWLGTGMTFGWQASSILWGTNPETASWMSHDASVTVNGLFVGLSGSGGNVSGGQMTVHQEQSWQWWLGENGTLTVSNPFYININGTTVTKGWVWGVLKVGSASTDKWF